MKKGIGKLFKSPAFLVIAVVVMMAAATLAYAHWSGTAPIYGDVHTGNIGAGFWQGSTNDDGYDNGWEEDVDLDDSAGGPPEIFDNWTGDFWPCDGNWDNDIDENNCGGPVSSADPLNKGLNPGRYDKDVARCSAEGHGDHLYFWVENGYPSYWCTVAGNMYGTGNVPVMTDGMDIQEDEFYRYWCTPWHIPGTDWEDEANQWHEHVSYDENGDFHFADHNGDEIFNENDFVVVQHCDYWDLDVFPQADGSYLVYEGNAFVLSFGPSEGSCGTQVDPFYGDWEFESPQDALYTLWMHIENGALQESSYHLGIKAKFINWNEWDDFNSCE